MLWADKQIRIKLLSIYNEILTLNAGLNKKFSLIGMSLAISLSCSLPSPFLSNRFNYNKIYLDFIFTCIHGNWNMNDDCMLQQSAISLGYLALSYARCRLLKTNKHKFLCLWATWTNKQFISMSMCSTNHSVCICYDIILWYNANVVRHFQ